MTLISGLALILICSALFSYSFYLSYKLKWKTAIILMMLSGLLLRIFISLDPNLHKWDERYHALVAKNLVNHPMKPTLYETPVLPYDFKDWSSNHIWLHKQPVTLWLMSFFIFLFGNTAFVIRLSSIILSTLSIYLLYLIGKKLFNHKVGFLAAFLFSINGLILELTGGRVATDHIDIHFMFFVLLAITNVIISNEKKLLRALLTGIIIGLAMLCKWLPALIVVLFWFVVRLGSSMNDKSWKKIIIEFIVIIVGAFIVFLPWQIYMYVTYPDEMKCELLNSVSHFSESLQDHSGSLFYFLDKIRINYSELIYLPLLWIIVQIVKKYDSAKMALFLWFIIPVIFFSIAKTKMQGYIVFACPPLFIFTAQFYYWLKEGSTPKLKWPSYIVSILLIVLPIRYSIERIKPFEKREDTEIIQPIKQFSGKNALLFNYPMPIESMFFSNVIASYSFIPGREVLDSLHSQGYNIYVNTSDTNFQINGADHIHYVDLISANK